MIGKWWSHGVPSAPVHVGYISYLLLNSCQEPKTFLSPSLSKMKHDSYMPGFEMSYN